MKTLATTKIPKKYLMKISDQKAHKKSRYRLDYMEASLYLGNKKDLKKVMKFIRRIESNTNSAPKELL